MTQEEIFLTLIRLGIGHQTSTNLSVVDWNIIKSLAYTHGLSAVVLDGVEKLPEDKRPPQVLLLQWIGEVLHDYEQRYEMYSRTIGEMAGFYNSHGYKMMVLKGYVCSLDWPKPEHRPCGDIDIWQFGEYKKADALISSEKGIKIDNSHHHHTVFKWNGFDVENHYDFIDVHHRKSSSRLERLFKSMGEDDTNALKVSGKNVYVPSTNFHALFLLYHTMLHFTSTEMTIRQLLDWGFFVKKHGSEIDWNWLLNLVEEFHLRDFFNIISAICVDELGFNASIFHEVQFKPELKDRVIKDTLSPEFTEKEPTNYIARFFFRFRRWKSHEWKHKLCYQESMWSIFWTAVWSHLLKPSSI